MSFAVPALTTGALTGTGVRVSALVTGAFLRTGLQIPEIVTGAFLRTGLRIPEIVTGALTETTDLIIPSLQTGDFRNERARDSIAVIGSTALVSWNPAGLNISGIATMSAPIAIAWNPTGLVGASSSIFSSIGTPGQTIFVGVISSTAMTSTGATPMIIFVSAVSTTAMTSTGLARRDIQAVVTSTAVVNGVVIGQARYFVSATSVAQIVSGIQFLRDYWDGWAFNLNTSAASFYENFKFNSFARIGKNYYGCDETGIHLLGGNLDGAAQIDSTITTSTSDLSEDNRPRDIQKRVPYAYISAKSSEAMTLTCLVEGQEYEYTFRAAKDKVAVSRVDIGKGLLGTFWQFELKNQNGADFEIDSLSVTPVATTRKI